jgi:hypothetical protein
MIAREREGGGSVGVTAASRKLGRGQCGHRGRKEGEGDDGDGSASDGQPATLTYGDGDKDRDSNSARMVAAEET